MFEHIKIVLCEPQHPGNIGAAARAMKNMGLTQLCLIAPKCFPNKVATDRASGAQDVLEQAEVVGSLDEAIQDCHWILGTSARQRAFPWPLVTAREGAQKIAAFAHQGQKTAILFGTEPSGLSNEQLQRCDYHLTIPTHGEYTSLNLAAAVQVVAYEIYHEIYHHHILQEQPPIVVDSIADKATGAEIAGLLAHFEETAQLVGFTDPRYPKKLISRVQRLFTKAQLEKEEVNILRGLFKSMRVFCSSRA